MSLRRWMRVGAGSAAAAVAIAVAFGVTPPTAQAADDQWWFDFYSVGAIHDQGLTGSGVKIAVVDSQINPDLPVFAETDLTVSAEALCVGEEPATSEVNDNSRHGSTVTALLIGNGQGPAGIRGIVPDASVTFYGYGNTDHKAETSQCEVPEDVALAAAATDPNPDTRDYYAQGIGDPGGYLGSWGWAVERAVADGADIMTTSVGATSYPGDSVAVARALEAGVIILAATPNNTKDYLLLPWSYRGVVGVSAMDADGVIQTDSVYGVPMVIEATTVTAAGVRFSSLGAPGGTWEDSNSTTGSSLATPLVAGMLALVSEKYPAATSNQLLQSLVINTGVDDHPLQRDTTNGYGYGFASPNHMLRVDPTQYDDVNPLLDKLGFDRPTDQEFADPAANPIPTAAPTSSAPDAAPGSEPPAWLAQTAIIGGIVLGVAVVIGGAVLIIVLTRRRRT